MKTYTYPEIIQKYGRPLDVALALGIVTMQDDYLKRCRASSRVCMWSKQGIGKVWQIKLAELETIEKKQADEKVLNM